MLNRSHILNSGYFVNSRRAGYLLGLAGLLVTPACNHTESEEPRPTRVLDFSTSGTLRANAAVQFRSLAPGAKTYAWTFGDGATSTLAHPLHTYRAAGAYTVALSVTDSAGTGQVSKTLNVGAALVQAVDFSTPTPVWTGTPTAFTSLAPGAQLFQWNFGDGATSADANPTHTFARAGTYQVTLSVDGPSGTGQITKSVVVTSTAAANAAGTFSCSKVVNILTSNFPPYTTTVQRLPGTTVELRDVGNNQLKVRVANRTSLFDEVYIYSQSGLPIGGPSVSAPTFPGNYFFAQGRTSAAIYAEQQGDSLLYILRGLGNGYTDMYYYYGKR